MTDNNDALCVAQQKCCCWQSPGTHRKAWGGNWAFLGGKPAWCFLTWEAQSTPSLQGSPLAPGTRSPCASWRTQLLSDGPLWSLCTTENEAQNFCVFFLREFIERAQCGYIYLEAVKHGNVDLHQSLVFPEGGSLSGVQAHLVCNLLGSKHENVEYNIICVIYLSSKPKPQFFFNWALDKSLYVLAGCYLQYVIAGRVTEVPHADLRAHVPATEGTGGELQAADLQHHVWDSWEGVPFQSQLFKPLIPWERYRRKSLTW